jgi:hypothetical protein
MIQDFKRYIILLFLVTQKISEVQLPAVTHRVYLDVEIDGQNIGISFLTSFFLDVAPLLHSYCTYY